VYKTGYHYHTGMSTWSPLTLTSTESLIASSWYPKTAQTTLTGLDLTTTHYVLGYVWFMEWKCLEMRMPGLGVHTELLDDTEF
jgi:hypothetical protein